jgi:nucleoside-diphosphate-sugar epimerase
MVTGAVGFVGASIVREMAHRGYRVVAYDVAPPSPLLSRYWSDRDVDVRFEQGSVLDGDLLAATMVRYEPSVVIHAAAVTAVRLEDEIAHGDRMVEVNVLGTLRVLAASRQARVDRLVHVSSAGLYRLPSDGTPLAEDHPTAAGNLYLISKEAAEKLCLRYGELHDLSAVVARLTQPYGPLERDTGSRPVLSVVYQLAAAALGSRQVQVGGGDYLCDWTSTFDIARAIRLLSEASHLDHRVFNISCGVATRLIDLFTELEQLVPGASFEFSQEQRKAPIRTEGDPRRGPLDISRLSAATGFRPEYDIRDGLRASIQWWKQS